MAVFRFKLLLVIVYIIKHGLDILKVDEQKVKIVRYLEGHCQKIRLGVVKAQALG